MSTRRMTRETRVERMFRGRWIEVAPINVEWLRDRGVNLRTVERYVTEWVEVVE